ncbi:MAG: FAD-dependent oxidoreductase [Defluviitaleaceae bacterium]|nr:FAD-dependent oxidoreductase [Defluviitaleaceae bacterium]
MSKKIIVLGAGCSGILIAKKLEKKFKNDDVDITIIDKNPFHTLLTELHEVAAWRVDETSIRVDLKKIFAGRNVNVVQDKIVSADYAGNTLVGERDTYSYDFLVLATGCKPTYFGVEGAEEHSFSLWSYDDAVRLREHILGVFRKASQEVDVERKKGLLNFYVVGAGFTGVEMAGELAEYAPIACDKFKIDPSLVRITIVDVLDRIITSVPEKVSNKAVKIMEKLGINISLNTRVVKIGENSITLVKDNESTTDTTHTVMWVAGTEGSDIAMDAQALGLKEGYKGRVELDDHLRSLKHPNVYVAGDNMFFVPVGQSTPVPQMVENCEHCSPIIVENIASELKGEQPSKVYNPTFNGEMVCIGGRKGVANVGRPGKRIALPSFLAMFCKHFINVIYFCQIAGWSKAYSYVANEVFTIRNRRSFVGGHFSNRSPLFFIVPLRLFLGIYFIYFAYRRYAMGWLSSPMLRNMYYDIAAQFRPALFEFGLFNQFRFSVYLANDTMHVWLQTTPVEWFLRNVVFASQGSEMFFQFLIAGIELLLGLAFIAGLFTSLASIGAIAIGLLIFTTVGFSIYQWWIPFAGIAFLFTGGKVLSLDYYVMPWLSKRWKNIGFIRKWYLYND